MIVKSLITVNVTIRLFANLKSSLSQKLFPPDLSNTWKKDLHRNSCIRSKYGFGFWSLQCHSLCELKKKQTLKQVSVQLPLSFLSLPMARFGYSSLPLTL